MKINQTFQDFIFDYKTYLTILYGGAGSSKSHSWTQKIIIKCIQSKRKVLVMRATQASLPDSCIALFREILDDEGIPYIYRKQESKILLGESVIMFKGGDNPERLKSIFGVTDIVLEEATEMSPDMFTQLMLRLRSLAPGLQITIAFNPVSQLNWVYRFFFDEEDPDYFLEGIDFRRMHSTYKDNAFLPEQYIKNLLTLRKSNPYYYTVYVEGEFGTLGKLIFPHGSYKIAHMQVPYGTKHIYGCDPGCTDKFAIIAAAILPDNTLYVYKEYCQSEVLCRDVAAWTKANIPSNAIIYTDCAGKAQIQELNGMGMYGFRANDKPAGSVLATIDTIKSYNLVISPDCENLLKDLTMYQWDKDKKTGLYKNEPAREVDGYHCDAIDALRYATQALGNNIRTVKLKNYKGL